MNDLPMYIVIDRIAAQRPPGKFVGQLRQTVVLHPQHGPMRRPRRLARMGGVSRLRAFLEYEPNAYASEAVLRKVEEAGVGI